MMDLYCPKCGEPCDLYEFHDIPGKTFDEARAAFFGEGCGALGMTCTPRDTLRGDVSGALAELLGDDVDGIASMMDDFDYLGMLD